MDKPAYSPQPTRIVKFLTALQRLGTPGGEVTQKYLRSVGFTSGNDNYLPGVLRYIGFIDSSKKPTQRWNDYKDSKLAPKVLGAALMEAYDDLFHTFPHANSQPNEDVCNFFRQRWGLSESVTSVSYATFKKLCEIAEFDQLGNSTASVSNPVEVIDERVQEGAKSVSHGVTLNVNIELQLPATTDADVYDKLFASLKKHLFSH